MNEFETIARYFKPLTEGRDALLDDAAVLSVPPGFELVVTSDTLNAGTHFMADAAAGDIARKALRVNLSDLAAMGARPFAYQLNIAFPARPSEGWLAEFTSALMDDQKTFGIFCSGGDTTTILGAFSISITAMG
ncbi:MAG: AIR synthase related protein, partial [Alphaproteobacteria bacterium]